MATEYPEWRKAICPHCAAGMEMCADGTHHWTGLRNPPACLAPSVDEYIAQLTQDRDRLAGEVADLKRRLAEAEKDGARLEYWFAHGRMECADLAQWRRIMDAMLDYAREKGGGK